MTTILAISAWVLLVWVYLGGVGLTDKRYDWEWPVKLGKALALWANKQIARPDSATNGERG